MTEHTVTPGSEAASSSRNGHASAAVDLSGVDNICAPRRNNGSPYRNDTADARKSRQARVRDAREEQYAARDRVHADIADTTAMEADAMADLRKVMAENADVFQSSGVLSHIVRFADSRSAGHYTVTLGVLARVVLQVPPQVVLPPIIGGEMSLNMLLALAGDSGGGKGAADKAADAAVTFSIGNKVCAPLPMLPIGTGEGINRTYAHSQRDKLTGRVELRWHTDRALFGCPDIATMDALLARRGATLVPELLKAYAGDPLGFANAGDDKRVILPQHSYRLSLSAGVQPSNGMVLLNEQAVRDGSAQRWVWAPVRPGVARQRRLASDTTVDPITVQIPDFGIDPMVMGESVGGDDDHDGYVPVDRPLVRMGIAETIAQQIIDADAVKDLDPFGRCDDPLESHRLLAQLKVAAALAILHGLTYVGPADWQRAEKLLAISSSVARLVTLTSARAAEHDAATKGRIDGHRLAASDDARTAAAVQTVIGRVTRALAKPDENSGEQTPWRSKGVLTRAVPSKHRAHLEDVLATLMADERVERRTVENAGQTVFYFRLKPSA